MALDPPNDDPWSELNGSDQHGAATTGRMGIDLSGDTIRHQHYHPPTVGPRGGDGGGTGSNNWVYGVPTAPTTKLTAAPKTIAENASALGQPKRVGFGKHRLPGDQLLYENVDAAGVNLYMVFALEYGPVQSILPRVDGTAMILMSGNHWTDTGATGGYVHCWTYDGSQVTVDSLSGLSTLDPHWNNPLLGMAYAIVKVTFNPVSRTSQPVMTFDMQGYNQLYDPRDFTEKYSENPALVIRELLVNPVFGARIPDDAFHIDDVLFAQAANDCDAVIFPATPSAAAPIVASAGSAGNITDVDSWWTYTCVDVNGGETLPCPTDSNLLTLTSKRANLVVPVGGANTVSRNVYRSIGSVQANKRLVANIADNVTTAFVDNSSSASIAGNASPPTKAPRSNRYSIGIVIQTSAGLWAWIDTLRAVCLGALVVNNGAYGLLIDQALPGGYVPKTFSETGAGANVIPGSISLSRKDRSQLYNSIIVNFVDQGNDYSAGTVSREWPTVTSGAEMPRLTSFQLDGVPDGNQGARLAVQMLNRAHDDLSVTFTATRDAISVNPWDVIAFTGAGLSGQLFRVRDIKGSGEDFVIIADEYAASSYVDTINPESAIVPTNLPDPSSPPPDPVSLTLTEDVPTGPSGGLTSKIRVDWVPALTPFYRETLITVNDGLTTYTLGSAQIGPLYIQNPIRGTTQLVTAQTVARDGKRSSGLQQSIIPVYTSAIVPDISGLMIPFDTILTRGNIYWTAPNYDFVDHYEVYDNFVPATPVLIASVHATASPTVTNPLVKLGAIHGDGFSQPQTFSILVKVVSRLGDKSPGINSTWTIAPNGQVSYLVGLDPRDAIYDGSSIWVSNFNGANIQQLSKATGAVLQTVTVGTKPFGITYGPTDLWVANYGGNTVNRVTLAGAVIQTISTGASSGPLGVIYDPVSGDVWVTCYTTGTLKRISVASNTITQTITVGTKPCLPFAFGGNIYVCNFGSNTVSVVSTVSNTAISTINVGLGPFGLCSDGQYLWVANYSDSTISKIDPVANTVIATIALATNSGPTDCAYDGHGYIWVSEAGTKQLTQIATATNAISGHVATASYPRTVIADGTNLWSPMNTNAASGTVPVTVVTGALTSNALPFTIVGVDVSPLPS